MTPGVTAEVAAVDAKFTAAEPEMDSDVTVLRVPLKYNDETRVAFEGSHKEEPAATVIETTCALFSGEAESEQRIGSTGSIVNAALVREAIKLPDAASTSTSLTAAPADSAAVQP